VNRYTIARGKEVIGEFSSEAIKDKLGSGVLTETDLVFIDGFTEWKKISDIPEFKLSVPPLPPILDKPVELEVVEEPVRQSGKIISKHNPLSIVCGILSLIFCCGGCLTFPWGIILWLFMIPVAILEWFSDFFKIFQCSLCGIKLEKPSGTNKVSCHGCGAHLSGIESD
jgi:hypothetical protein